MTEMIDAALLLLQCPITRRPLVKAEQELLDHANAMVHRHAVTNRLGEVVMDLLDEGLVDEAGEWLYAVRNGIVSLSADEAISLHQFDLPKEEANA